MTFNEMVTQCRAMTVDEIKEYVRSLPAESRPVCVAILSGPLLDDDLKETPPLLTREQAAELLEAS
jgi:hypothetical protein